MLRKNQTRLILASTSRYRKELLERLCIPFSVHKPEVDETPFAGETPAQLCERLAILKAETIAEQFPNALVIGSDQAVDLDGQILGKPGNYERAMKQLKMMSGKTVTFQTAIAVVHMTNDFAQTRRIEVKVQFRTLIEAEIDRYLRTEEPYDCAGSAKSEGLGITLLEAIHNPDPTALIGLPLIATASLLRATGLQLP